MYVLDTYQDLHVKMHETYRIQQQRLLTVKKLNTIHRNLKHLNQYSKALLFTGVTFLKNPINGNIAK